MKVRNAYGQWIDKKGVPHPKRKITLHTPAGYSTDDRLTGEQSHDFAWDLAKAVNGELSPEKLHDVIVVARRHGICI